MSRYKDVSGEIIVDTVWIDDNDADSRPDTYKLNVHDSFGNSKSYDIGKTSTEYVLNDFPFAKNGVINVVSASVDGIQGYTSTLTTRRQDGKTHFFVTHTRFNNTGDQFQPGYQTVSYNGATYNIYKMSGGEKLALMTTSQNADGTYPTMSIKKFAEASHVRVKAVVNASYFNCDYSNPGSIYNTTAYGRIQGMDVDGNYINSTTPGPDDGVSGDKPYMDLVIEPDGTVVAGDLNSWDYHWGSDIGYPNEVMAGVSPAVIEILNGSVHEMYSPAVSAAKMTTQNTQTALIKTEDGSFALLATTSAVSPRTDLRNFGVDNNLSELSVYDSGGSTQMVVGTTPIIYTGRTIPDVWVIYEDEADVNPEEKIFSIIFNDIEGTTDLRTYTIIRSLSEGSVSTGIAEMMSSLYNRGYEATDDTWMNYDIIDYDGLDEQVTEITVNLRHRKDSVVSHEDKVYTRTIKFINFEGDALRDAEIQTLHASVDGTGTKDLVTGEITYDDTVEYVWEDDNSTYPEIAAPEIEGYSPKQRKVTAQNIRTLPEEERNRVEVIEYNKESTIVTVLVQYLDTDETDPQDLSEYGNTYSVDTSVHEQVDLSPVINRLTAKHYVVVDKPIIDGKMQNVIVKLRHDTVTESTTQACETVIVPVQYDDSEQTDTLEIRAEGQVATVETTDLVTGKITTDTQSTCHVEPFAVPGKDGYIANPEMINGYAEGEAPSFPEKIVYQRIPPETRTFNIIFNDVSSDPQNLEVYSRQVVLYEGEEKEFPAEETIEVLESLNYEIDYDTVPETINYDGDETIVISVSHKSETKQTPVGDTIYTREISFVDSDGNSIKNTEYQTATNSRVFVETIDSVTGKTLTSYNKTEWKDDINWFEEFAIPQIPGYETPEGFVAKAIINTDHMVTKVAIPYHAVTDIHDFTVEFEDINEDAQDLSEYKKTYSIEMHGETSTALSEANSQIEYVKSLGYKIVERPATVNVSDPTLTVKVDHTYTETEIERELTGVRTIHFVGIDRDDYQQAVTAYARVKQVTDNVTGTTADTVTQFTGEYPEYIPEREEGYSFDPATVPPLAIDSEQALSVEASVTYTKNPEPEKDIHTFTVKFEDINSDAQNLERYTKTYDIDMNGQASTTLSDADGVIKEVEKSGYVVVSRDATVSVSNPVLVVRVDHTYSETELDQSVDAIRTIAFEGVLKDPIEQRTTAIRHIKRITDNVTDKTTETLTSITGEFPEYVAEMIDGYTFTPEVIPTTEINSEDDLSVTATVTYTKTSEPEPDYSVVKLSSELRFEDGRKAEAVDERFKLVNTVDYSGLKPGRTYCVRTILESSADVFTVASRPVGVIHEKDTEFTAENAEGTLVIEIELSANDIDEDTDIIVKNTLLNMEKVEMGISDTETQEEQRTVTLKKNTTVISERDVYVNFIDEYIEPKDLSGYRIKKTVGIGEDALIDISSAYNGLMNKGFVFDISETTVVVPADINEITINVTHRIDEYSSTETKTATRTIHFAGIEREDDIQTAEINLEHILKEDAVTGETISDVRKMVGLIPAYTVAQVENYKSDRDTLSEINFENANPDSMVLNYEVTITFVSDYDDTHDVNIRFEDINSVDPTDLSDMNFVRKLEAGSSEELNLTAEIKLLESLGYEVANEDELPERIGDDTEAVTVKFVHTTSSLEETFPLQVTRKIMFDGISRDTETQIGTVSRTVCKTKDNVTGKIISSAITLEGSIQEYIVPQIDGYKSDTNVVEAIALTDESQLDENYDVVVKFTKNIVGLSVTYLDTDNVAPNDLSEYTEYVDNDDDNFQIDDYLNSASESAAVLTAKGYVIGSTEKNDTGYAVLLTHSVSVDRTSAEKTIVRNIEYKYSHGISINTVMQKAFMTITTVVERDAVTGRILNQSEEKTEVSGKAHILEAIKSPDISGFEASESTVNEVDILRESVNDEETIVILYSKIADVEPNKTTDTKGSSVDIGQTSKESKTEANSTSVRNNAYHNAVVDTADAFTKNIMIIVLIASVLTAMLSAKLILDDRKQRKS